MSCLSVGERKKILVPLYHCGVEVEAILRAGLEVVFYPLKKNLEIDFDWLEKNLSNDIGTILIMHYYGFPQPLAKIRLFCNANNLFLIEDCAHALYSANGIEPMGTFGDIAIYSIMKTIGLPNGGGLLINNKNFACPVVGQPYFSRALFKTVIRSMLEFEANCKPKRNRAAVGILKKYNEKQKQNYTDDATELEDKLWYYEVPQFYYQHTISLISKFFLRPLPVKEIINRRSRNYKILMSQINWNKEIRPLFDQLNEGVCPLCLPIRVQDSDVWNDKFRQNNIIPFVFGRFSHPLLIAKHFSGIETFQKGIIGLPVHQQLQENDMNEIAIRVNMILEEIS